MPQKKFYFSEIDETEIGATKKFLENSVYDLKKSFNDFRTFQNVIFNHSAYSSEDTTRNQKPEDMVKETLIRPMLTFLGYKFKGETTVKSPLGRRHPDFTIYPENGDPRVYYVEVEPINTNLYLEKRGRGQVYEWLLSRASETEYGIATDGLIWILVKFEVESNNIRDILTADLRPFFKKNINKSAFINEDEIDKGLRSFIQLRASLLGNFINGYLVDVEEKKEDISQNFYQKYVNLVFGLDKTGSSTGQVCLLNSIKVPGSVSRDKIGLFSVVTMNRLIFITFLENKGIVHQNLLSGLYADFQKSHHFDTFYNTHLKRLFYEVFNKSPDDRSQYIKDDQMLNKIPYLNGGLFREVVEAESDYNISDDALAQILNELLGKYRIGVSDEAEIRPEILGYIFEKTINYISGSGTNKQKMLGAYYTPDDVVHFIIKNTLDEKIFAAMIQGLKQIGWKDSELRGLATIEDILTNAHIHKKAGAAMLNAIEKLRCIDPACGSGHFLNSALNEITRVESSILLAMENEVNLYEIKRKLVRSNIYGVDIDPIGAEITRLRLWLSIISDADRNDVEHIKALPNIDFNILSGNALIGALGEKLMSPISDQPINSSEISMQLFNIGRATGRDVSDIAELLQSRNPLDIVTAYQKLVDIYKDESGEKALTVREFIANIREKLQEYLTESYLSYIFRSTETGTKSEKLRSIAARGVFHWILDFSRIIESGGFDIVIGNPPYIEDGDYSELDLEIIHAMKRERNNSLVPLMYQSMNCGNTHAYFIERSIKLLRTDGILGLIVPVSIVSTPRMGSIREIIHANSASASYYNFDDRPGKIFSGIEHCRSTIVIARKGNGIKSVYTSKYLRWYTEYRPSLFDNIPSVKYDLKRADEIIPKIGTKLENALLRGLTDFSSGKTLGEFLEPEGSSVWYHNAPQYWIHAHSGNNVPKVEYYSNSNYSIKNGQLSGKPDKTEPTSQYKQIKFNEKYADFVMNLLNSSLFYWWFVTYSDGRHLNNEHISSFPIDLKAIPTDILSRSKELADTLMRDYERNSREKINVRKGGYAIRIKEIVPKLSFSIIEEIDKVIAQVLNLSMEESEFISNFDRSFRLGKQGSNTEEDKQIPLN